MSSLLPKLLTRYPRLELHERGGLMHIIGCPDPEAVCTAAAAALQAGLAVVITYGDGFIELDHSEIRGWRWSIYGGPDGYPVEFADDSLVQLPIVELPTEPSIDNVIGGLRRTLNRQWWQGADRDLVYACDRPDTRQLVEIVREWRYLDLVGEGALVTEWAIGSWPADAMPAPYLLEGYAQMQRLYYPRPERAQVISFADRRRSGYRAIPQSL